MDDDWRPLDSLGFPMYEAHNSGIIRRKSNKRILQRKAHKGKYIKLCMKHNDGTYKNVKADGLICKIFIGPPNGNVEVIHINGDTLDSRVSNLKWGTPTEKNQVDTAQFSSLDYITNITLPSEEWRDCSPYGYVDYLASSLGRIYSMKTGKVLSGYLRPDGYTQVNISINGENKENLMHVLICHAFHGNSPDEMYTVDHIDRNKTNNVPGNLRWASKTEQCLNRDEFTAQTILIAQIRDDKIIDFHEEQSVLEIFDVDQIAIPDEGMYFLEDFWIYENCTNLDMMDETWSPVRIGDTIRLISNMGRVQIGNRKTFGTTLRSGYKSVGVDGRPLLVHKLVITAFRGVYDPDLVINHIDRDRSNNRLNNLEVITKSENTIHAVSLGHKSLKAVQQIAKDGSIIAVFPSIQAASNATGIIHSSIGKVANGKQKTAGGFSWRFIE